MNNDITDEILVSNIIIICKFSVLKNICQILKMNEKYAKCSVSSPISISAHRQSASLSKVEEEDSGICTNSDGGIGDKESSRISFNDHQTSTYFDVHLFLQKTLAPSYNRQTTADNAIIRKDQHRSMINDDQCEQLIPPTVVSNCLSAISLSSSSSSSRYFCRICHLPNESTANPMIWPCRCAGTMRFVHTACLVRWLEISTKQMMFTAPRCELCGYYYKRHNCFDLQRLHLPHICKTDRILHSIFVLVFIVMIICATVSIHLLNITDQRYASNRSNRLRSSMTIDNLSMIICSALFFFAFFIAVFTQYRADASLFRIAFRCWLINRNWRIRNYARCDDDDIVVENGNRKQLEILFTNIKTI